MRTDRREALRDLPPGARTWHAVVLTEDCAQAEALGPYRLRRNEAIADLAALAAAWRGREMAIVCLRVRDSIGTNIVLDGKPSVQKFDMDRLLRESGRVLRGSIEPDA